MALLQLRRGLIACGGLLILSMFSQAVLAHGYIVSPEARGYACKLGQNTDCGAIIWEPQSLEAPKGFPGAGPSDGQIASAAVGHFSQLNAQTATRWSKRIIQTGANNFTWRFTANHSSQGWRYFMTKQGWNPNSPLGRSSFDLNPFCSVDGQYRQPPIEVTHRCNVPGDRSGYHVILAVWDIGDTGNAFYNVIDVNVGNTTTNPNSWSDVGDINPVTDLSAGDQVRARVFSASGENTSLETRITIGSAEEGRKDSWPRLLAQAINLQQSTLRAGRLDAQGNIVPALGKNDVFARAASGIQRVEVTVEQVQTPVVQLDVSGVKNSYSIVNGQATIDFTVAAQGNYVVDSTLFDASNRQVGQNRTNIANSLQAVRITLASPRAGQYSLVVRGTPSQGQMSQQNFTLTLTDSTGPVGGGYDYVYPQSIQAYKAGTKVLGADGNIYQCKPFPYSGWCTINAHQYTPGSGSNWQDAWIRTQ